MSKHAWQTIREQFREQYSATGMSDPDTFWSEFRRRAPARREQVRYRPAPLTWAVAGACAMLLAATLAVQFGAFTGNASQGTIRSLDVIASHQAVLIMDDKPGDSTILWVVGMQVPAENGDST